MNNKKQSAVDWYFNQSERLIIYYKTKRMSATELDLNLKEIQGIAKEMEKEQIIDAYHINPKETKWNNQGIEYYKETYEK